MNARAAAVQADVAGTRSGVPLPYLSLMEKQQSGVS